MCGIPTRNFLSSIEEQDVLNNVRYPHSRNMTPTTRSASPSIKSLSIAFCERPVLIPQPPKYNIMTRSRVTGL